METEITTPSDEQMKQLMAWVPKTVHRRLQGIAIDRDSTLTNLVREALDDFFQKQSGGTSEPKIDRRSVGEYLLPQLVSVQPDMLTCTLALGDEKFHYTLDCSDEQD
jgi:hypothetical protein